MVYIGILFATSNKTDEDYESMSEQEDPLTESLEQETMRSLATDMQTVKMQGFKYNQSIADVLSIKDSLLANYNKLN